MRVTGAHGLVGVLLVPGLAALIYGMTPKQPEPLPPCYTLISLYHPSNKPLQPKSDNLRSTAYKTMANLTEVETSLAACSPTSCPRDAQAKLRHAGGTYLAHRALTLRNLDLRSGSEGLSYGRQLFSTVRDTEVLQGLRAAFAAGTFDYYSFTMPGLADAARLLLEGPVEGFAPCRAAPGAKGGFAHIESEPARR